jgi:hypothetical protein
MNTRQVILNSLFILLVTSLLGANIAFAAKLKVLAADPVETEVPVEASKQLPVKVIGSGFDSGTNATFLVSGSDSDTGGITVISTDFVSDTELNATIEVAVEASIGAFDIKVVTSRGRRGKGNSLFTVKQVGGGNVLPTFDVEFLGPDMLGIGTNWLQKTSTGSMIKYFLSDPQGGSADINLDYFRLPSTEGGPFLPGRGENCFGDDLLTPIISVQLWGDQSDDAILKLQFIGKTEDHQLTTSYHLTLTGYFHDLNNWLPLPLEEAYVTMTTWKLKLTSKRLGKKYLNVSCVGEGDFNTTIKVVRNN